MLESISDNSGLHRLSQMGLLPIAVNRDRKPIYGAGAWSFHVLR
jgi:hypothetical protein